MLRPATRAKPSFPFLYRPSRPFPTVLPYFPTVIPAQAGIQDGTALYCDIIVKRPLDSRLRGNDGSMGYWIPAYAGRTVAGPPPHPLILNLQLHPLILNLLKDGQRRLERQDRI